MSFFVPIGGQSCSPQAVSGIPRTGPRRLASPSRKECALTVRSEPVVEMMGQSIDGCRRRHECSGSSQMRAGRWLPSARFLAVATERSARRAARQMTGYLQASATEGLQQSSSPTLRWNAFGEGWRAINRLNVATPLAFGESPPSTGPNSVTLLEQSSVWGGIALVPQRTLDHFGQKGQRKRASHRADPQATQEAQSGEGRVQLEFREWKCLNSVDASVYTPNVRGFAHSFVIPARKVARVVVMIKFEVGAKWLGWRLSASVGGIALGRNICYFMILFVDFASPRAGPLGVRPSNVLFMIPR
ncbi:hypothetical protein R1flu_022600 [Riccia fluitans]|uniref:Uncharacterized protein n=1 Tax=Riccia fluitans TaxID=41844 RepID=A0ABD1XQB7_9MARC